MFAIFSRTNRSLITALFALLTAPLSGCGSAKIDDAIVIAPEAIIRSSTATVSLPVKKLKRGDRLDIFEQATVKTPTRVEEWYKVSAVQGGEVGWIEARYLINKNVVDKIEALFQGSKDLPSQGIGRLKVQARLRLDAGGDVVTHLNRGTMVEIVGKARTTIKERQQEEGGADDQVTEEPDVRTVLWYQVRMPESEVVRAGWIGAQQVELDVPDEILHLEGEGRRFTGWIVYDQTRTKKGEVRNNYIGLMKSLSTEGPIDFTRLWFLNYSPDSNRYGGPYIEDGLRGILPVTLGTKSGGKGFTIQELDENGKPVAISYEVNRAGPERIAIKRLSPKFQIKKIPKAAKPKQ
jgi:hypothetical protein